ncbi:IS256 family transposase [Ureaplasma ceti]|uniref:Mutator family transposase n=1 Tax=Ureaplasma ceti TaxID=3119530 RepID=A0ABP9U8H0_9BACT
MIKLMNTLLLESQLLERETNKMLNEITNPIEDLERFLNQHLVYVQEEFLNIQKLKGATYSKNSYKERILYTLNGMLKLKVPQIRGVKQINYMLDKWQKYCDDFEQFIALLILNFISWDSIIEIVHQHTGISIGHSTIDRINKKVKSEYLDKFQFPITDEYQYVFVDACYYKVKQWYNDETGEVLSYKPEGENGTLFKKKSFDKAVFTAIGIDKNGYKKLLGLETLGCEDANTWTHFLTSLKDRGLSNPSVIICDDFSGINNVIHAVYEDAKIQKCVIHKVRNAMTSVPAKYRKIFLRQLRKIYCSDTRAEADFAFNSLKEVFGKQLPSAVRIIERSLEEILLFLTLPMEVRRFIYTNNISENFNSALRKYVKKKAHSRTNELSMRLLM